MPSQSRPSVTHSSKKQPPRKGKESKGSKALEGEGSYTGTRDYNRHLKDDLKVRDVEKSAVKARRALEGDESIQLRDAEKKGKRGPFGSS